MSLHQSPAASDCWGAICPLNGPSSYTTVSLTHSAQTPHYAYSSHYATLYATLEGPGMVEPQQEKRAARRFALRVPVTVNRGQTPQNESAQIRDVSARGICFYLESAIEQGSNIGFTLTLPPEITLTESIRVQCKGRVVRVEDSRSDGKGGVAAVIEEYEFLPEA